MVDGVTPHMDPGKPAGTRPPKGSSYIKQEVEFRPAGKGNHSGRPEPKNRPYNAPSFGMNSYGDNDEAAGQVAPSNNVSTRGDSGPKTMDGLSNSGSSTEEAEGQGLSSIESKVARPKERKEEDTGEENRQEERDDDEEEGGSEEEVGEEVDDSVGESKPSDEMPNEDDENSAESSDSTDEAKKQDKANRFKKAQDSGNTQSGAEVVAEEGKKVSSVARLFKVTLESELLIGFFGVFGSWFCCSFLTIILLLFFLVVFRDSFLGKVGALGLGMLGL